MNINKTVYLAGPIDGLSFREGVEWRQYAQKQLATEGVKGISPQRGKDYIGENAVLSKDMDFVKQEALFSDNIMSTAEMIMTRDKFDALNCDVLLVNFHGAKRASIGTVMEIAWAYLQGKPVIVVADEDDTLHRKHPMLRKAFSCITSDLDEAIEVVLSIFRGY